jgi:hypothetical protein
MNENLKSIEPTGLPTSIKNHLKELEQFMEWLSPQNGMPPVSSRDVVGRCLGNLIGTLFVVA